jgi:hypothetical protein
MRHCSEVVIEVFTNITAEGICLASWAYLKQPKSWGLMFTELFCPDGIMNPWGAGPEIKGQFYIVVCHAEEAIELIARHKIEPYSVIRWLHDYSRVLSERVMGGFQETPPQKLDRYAPDETIITVSPDGKLIFLLQDNLTLDAGARQHFMSTLHKIERFHFSQVKELKTHYPEVLRQYPYLLPYQGRTSNARLPLRIGLIRLELQFNMMEIPRRIEDAFQMPKGVPDDDLTMAYFVVKLFEEAKRDLHFANTEVAFPYKNDDIIVNEFKYRIKQKLSFNPRFYPLDSVKSGEIEKRVTRAIRTLQELNNVHDESTLLQRVKALSDDELCEALLTAYYFDRHMGYFFNSFKFLIIVIHDRIAGRDSL